MQHYNTGISNIVQCYNTGITSIVIFTGITSIVIFTILVLPVLSYSHYWKFQYCIYYNTGNTSIVTLYNTRNTSIVMLQYRKSSIVYIQYWIYQYRAFTILEYQNRTSIAAGCFILSQQYTTQKTKGQQYDFNIKGG
jgi:hypothetical protein